LNSESHLSKSHSLINEYSTERMTLGGKRDELFGKSGENCELVPDGGKESDLFLRAIAETRRRGKRKGGKKTTRKGGALEARTEYFSVPKVPCPRRKRISKKKN